MDIVSSLGFWRRFGLVGVDELEVSAREAVELGLDVDRSSLPVELDLCLLGIGWLGTG